MTYPGSKRKWAGLHRSGFQNLALHSSNLHPDPHCNRLRTAKVRLTEADQAKGSGGVGALLRREGLYSSVLTGWRRERAASVLQALAPHKRGPKSKRDPIVDENVKLRRETQCLTEELRKAEIVIDIQKKWPRCWVARF